jgi:hypothetical protein
MNDMKKQQAVTLCGETLTGPLHVCAFFDSRDEQYETLLPWIKEGIENNEEIINILDGSLHQDHCCRLSKADIPVQDAVTCGQLKLFATDDTYLLGGIFAAERMVNILEQALIEAQNGPYGTFRGYGEMEWALKNLPGTDELIEYEARINTFAPKYDCSIVCAYDINRFSGRAVADILATHPYVIMHGKIHKNPHFIEPIALLKRLIKAPKRPLSSLRTDHGLKWN